MAYAQNLMEARVKEAKLMADVELVANEAAMKSKVLETAEEERMVIRKTIKLAQVTKEKQEQEFEELRNRSSNLE